MTNGKPAILPTNVRPERYELTLTPDLATFTFSGEEKLSVEVLEPTTSVVLNSAEIAVQSASLTPRGGTALTPRSTDFDEQNETVSFEFDAPVPAGPAELSVEFTGELNNRLRGFYRSQYVTLDGETRFLATTQFEATDARRAFPCWDEPALKARFAVTLVVPSALATVSNMPISSEADEGGGLKRVTFGETPPMSTYLLAFIVGDLKYVEDTASGGTSIRIWTTAGNEEKGRFALDVSVRLLDYFNDYFGIPYPLDKLDHLAIPDFAAGAMENWGAITYRETALLVDPDQSSAATRQRVAEVVAHEMAHMWFGDLVTMAWWNDLWLNESFASWMGDKSVDHLFPEWEMWTQFVAADTSGALRLDGLQNSHPIEQPVNNAAEIGELFDAISYSKGGSILRMLEQYVGPDDFRRGLGLYMERHKYGNARTTDLWDALGEASSLPVRAMMDTWVNQTGYPVLSVQVGRGTDGPVVAAQQRRFLYEHVIDPEATDQTLWHVPLSIASAAGSSPPTVLMDGAEAAVHLVGDDDPAGGWIKLNPGQTGFYRVDYGHEGWDRLIGPIQDLALPAVDRLGVQNDAYALSRAGMLPITTFLTIAQAYVNETDASVWEDLASNLSGLDSLIADEPHHASFQGFARDVVRPAGERIGWDPRDGEGHLDSLLRSTLLSALGHYGDDATLDEAVARFAKYAAEPDSVHPDVRTVVLRLAAKRGDRTTYDTMWERYAGATLEEEKVRVLTALSRFEDPQLLEETLTRSLTEEVRVHDAVSVAGAVGSSPKGRDLAWGFLKDNWDEYNRRYGDGGFALMRLVSITARFSSRERLEDVEAFFKDHPTPAAERTLRQSLEAIRLNIAWLDQNRETLAIRFAG